MLISSCEPLATDFDDTEEASCYTAATLVAVPDTFTSVRVMTWNIRFVAARLEWFGDACGDRVILSEEEVWFAARNGRTSLFPVMASDGWMKKM